MDIICIRCNINKEVKAAEFPKKMRKKLINSLKDFRIRISSIDGPESSVITMGGNPLKEINPITMESKITPNLYIAGEALDLDAPTGGYNMQVAFTTGYVAAMSAAIMK
jgi:predicted flavoprotein YhiN